MFAGPGKMLEHSIDALLQIIREDFKIQMASETLQREQSEQT